MLKPKKTNTVNTTNISETNWHFNWGAGGYNTVKATSREEAMAKAVEKGKGWNSKGVVDLTHDPDFALMHKSDKQYAGMFD